MLASRVSRNAIRAADAFTVVVAFDVQLEALTIAFPATRALAGAALNVLEGLPSGTFRASLFHFGHKGFRIALQDVDSRLFDHLAIFFYVTTVSTTALFSTFSALCETVAVHFKTLRS